MPSQCLICNENIAVWIICNLTNSESKHRTAVAFPSHIEALQKNIDLSTPSCTLFLFFYFLFFCVHILSFKRINFAVTRKRETVVDMVEKFEAFTRSLSCLIWTCHLEGYCTSAHWRNDRKRDQAGALSERWWKISLSSWETIYPPDLKTTACPRISLRLYVILSQCGEFSSLAKKTISSLDEATIQTELIEFQTSSQIRDALRSAESLCVLWVSCSEEYSTKKKLAFHVLTMFGLTYTCESSFSFMSAI
jgi:hypothetical protein